MDPQQVVNDFVECLKETYRERQISTEEQWPPVRGDKLINLQLVETDVMDGFRAGLSQHGASVNKVKRTPILCSDLFKSGDCKKPVRKLLIEGNGGMGKTTLCTMLAEGWAEGKILTNFDLVILLPLREELVSSATSLSDLLKLLHDSESVCSTVTDHIERRRGKGVLIIADGWDEIEEQKRSKKSFLYKFFFGHYLRSASVLLTSRPSASAPLHNLPSVDRLVEVVGFSEKNIKQYIESEFKLCPEKAFALIEKLESTPLIQSVCSVPLNCAIICNLWRTLDQELPGTLTKLYALILLNVMYRGITKKFPNCSIGKSLDSFDSIPGELQAMFWLTCKFAYECLSRDQVVFSEKEFTILFSESLDSGDKFLCFGLLQSAQSLLPVGHGLSFHFLHLTFQEFLAALHLVCLPTEEQLQFCEAHATSSRFAMVWRFAFGLGSKNQIHGLRGNSTIACLDDEVVDRFVSALTYWNDKLLLCHCALESQDAAFSKIVAGRTKGHFKIGFNDSIAHSPHDCVAVYHVLRHTAHCPDVRINLSGCGHYSEVWIREFANVLSSAGSKLNVRYLYLDNNNLTYKSITDLLVNTSTSFTSLVHLSLDGNNIDDVMPLFLNTSCKSLTRLPLSGNPLGVSGIQSLKAAVQAGLLENLNKLYLSNTLTSDADVNGALLTTLSTSIVTHCFHLSCLDLSLR